MDESISPSTSSDEEYQDQEASGPARTGSQTYAASPTKRRNPGSSVPSNNRDTKTRKKDDRRGGPEWGEKKRDNGKEDLVDLALADYLRKSYGDPFLETELKTLA